MTFTIPPRPEVLIKLTKEFARTEPDIDLIIMVLKQDPGLYSLVLSAANLPGFGRTQQVSSISHAIMLLGLKRLFSLIRLSVMKRSLSSDAQLERFWDTATEVAFISQEITKRYTTLDQDTAYTIGMLHDCGIPLMIQADKTFKDLLRDAHGKPVEVLLTLEQTRYGVNHFTLGAKLAEKWQIPTIAQQVIHQQAEAPARFKDSGTQTNDELMYLAILMLAKDISKNYRHFWRLEKDSQLSPVITQAFEYLGLCDYDYLDLREELLTQLERN